jgi:hypothetical protein
MGLTGNHHSPILGAHGFSLLTGAHFFATVSISFRKKNRVCGRKKQRIERKILSLEKGLLASLISGVSHGIICLQGILHSAINSCVASLDVVVTRCFNGPSGCRQGSVARKGMPVNPSSPLLFIYLRHGRMVGLRMRRPG